MEHIPDTGLRTPDIGKIPIKIMSIKEQINNQQNASSAGVARYIYATGAVALASYLYVPVFVWLYNSWFAKNSNYSHGFWVPPVMAYLAAKAIPRQTELVTNGDMRGLRFIMIAVLMRAMGELTDLRFISGLSLIPLIYGGVRYFAGIRISRAILPILLLVLFMVPLPVPLHYISVPLQTLSTKLSTSAINAIGIDAVRSGNVMQFSDFSLFVEAPCSGLNAIYSLAFIAAVLCFVIPLTRGQQTLLMCATLPVAILSNVGRIVLLSLVGIWFGKEATEGWFHMFSGMLVFAIGLLLYSSLVVALKWLEARKKPKIVSG